VDWSLIESSLFLAATAADEPSFLMGWLGTLQSLLYVAIGLGFVIFVHELGHFLVAKACGVKCEKFYVGFDFLEIPIPFTPWKIPRSLFKIQIGETEYGIGSLPLGGYVKMLGQDDDPRNAEAEAERTKAHADSTTSPAGEGLTLGSTIEKTGEALTHSHPDPVKNSDAPAKPAVAVKTSDGKTMMLDPRSYTAKSVPARMAIISAGVIMNAIFAVVFATIAYRMGVEEIPAGVGAVTPGDSAWQAGVEPGERIVAFGKDTPDYELLRYDDLLRAVVLNGKNQKLAFKVRDLAGKEKWHEVQPVKKEGNKHPTIGVMMLDSTKIFVPKPAAAETDNLERLLPKSSAPLKTDDKIVAIDGHAIASGAELAALLVQRPRGPLKLSIEREEERPKGSDPKADAPVSKHEITLEEKPVLELGVVLQMGPVKAIRSGSPAESAGFLVGDQIETIDDEPVGDPLTLGQRLLGKVGQAVKIQVSRQAKNGPPTTKEFTATLEAPRNLFPLVNYKIGGQAAAEPLGVSFELVPTVASVIPGSAAEKAKLQKGDQLLSAKLEIPKRAKPTAEDKTIAKLPKLDFVKNPDQWLKLSAWIQEVKPDVTVNLEFKRGDKTFHELLSPELSKEHFNEARGIDLIPEHRTNIAKDWSRAFWLGRRETKERIQEVFLVLHRLVTLQLSPTNLSGPPGILTAATKFASNGIPAMLIFLTILSANLAVINFLPIPVLDGGHMMFLAAEWIRGRPVDADLQYKLTLMGLFFLLSLMVFASAMDVGRFLNF
jgi:regulator of sigma E protease